MQESEEKEEVAKEGIEDAGEEEDLEECDEKAADVTVSAEKLKCNINANENN